MLWQHGLGADRKQPAEVFPKLPGVRRITLECRGHGESELGPLESLSIGRFAEDVVELLQHLGIAAAVVGGISLGAAISLRLAALRPDRVSGLLLARPAWVADSSPSTMRPYLLVAGLLAEYGREEGLLRFTQSSLFEQVKDVSPDNAASLQSFFAREREETTIALLSRIPLDGPGVTISQIGAISVPTLVIGNGDEYVHPLLYAEQLSSRIPGAEFREICSKTKNPSLYKAQFQDEVRSFLRARLEAA